MKIAQLTDTYIQNAGLSPERLYHLKRAAGVLSSIASDPSATTLNEVRTAIDGKPPSLQNLALELLSTVIDRNRITTAFHPKDLKVLRAPVHRREWMHDDCMKTLGQNILRNGPLHRRQHALLLMLTGARTCEVNGQITPSGIYNPLIKGQERIVPLCELTHDLAVRVTNTPQTNPTRYFTDTLADIQSCCMVFHSSEQDCFVDGDQKIFLRHRLHPHQKLHLPNPSLFGHGF